MSSEFCSWLWSSFCPTADGWVQADVASVAMSVGALAIWWQVRRQAKQEGRRRLAEEVQRLSIIADGAFACRSLCQMMLDHDKNGGQIDDMQRTLVGHARRLKAIPTLDVPDWRASQAITGISLTAFALNDALNEIVGGTQTTRHGRRVPYFNAAIDNLSAEEGLLRYTLQSRKADVPKRTIRVNDATYRSLSVEQHATPP